MFGALVIPCEYMDPLGTVDGWTKQKPEWDRWMTSFLLSLCRRKTA